MRSQFRSTSSADAPAISAFLKDIFDMTPENPAVDPRHMQWKFWDEWGDWPESRGYVMTQDEGIVAHGAVVPLTCLWDDRRIKVVRVIDWGAKAKPVGSGVMLMKRIGQMADAVMAVGGTEMTLKIFAALGAKKCGMAHCYARPLRPLRRMLSEKGDWRAGARFARGLVWSLQAPSLIPAGWTARRVTPSQLASTPFPRPTPSPGMAVFERSTASLDYYLRCPSVPFELYMVERNQVARGYFLLAILPRQVRIAESWVDSQNVEDWRALHLLAVHQARQHSEAVEVATMCSDPVTRQSLEECGFHDRGSVELHLLDCSRKGLPVADLRVQMLEGDAAYLHDGSGSLFA